MIRRTMDAGLVNRLANDPSIRPYIGGGDGTLDLSELVGNPANYVIEGEGGAWVLQPILEGVYELHTLFLPEGRGKSYMVGAREALRMMFTETDCWEIVTKCPDDNPGARMAATLIGFRERFRRENAWAPDVGISYQVFGVDDWFVRDKECLREGVTFHEVLEAAKPVEGSELPEHPEDQMHDRAAGAAALMIHGGHPDKGVAFYNRWAIFAGYPPIAQVAPYVFDIGEGVIVEFRRGEMAVLRTR